MVYLAGLNCSCAREKVKGTGLLAMGSGYLVLLLRIVGWRVWRYWAWVSVVSWVTASWVRNPGQQ